jgi:aldehyde dehydrogenase (NAD+)
MSNIPGIIEKQKRFFGSGATLDISRRLRALRALGAAVRANSGALCDALAQDMRRPEYEAFTGDVGVVLNEITYAIRRLRQWAGPRRVATPLACFYARSYSFANPYGVCLIVAPWNFPVQLVLSPLVGALAAGNCAVVKPSEVSIHTSAVLAGVLRDCFDEAHVAVVEGDAEVSRELCSQDFDYMFFSGSSAVGREVMKAAARRPTPVTLELGGKCPCIVDREVNVGVAARRIAWGKFYNAGQMCVAPDYVAVHREIKDRFVAALRRHIHAFYGPDPKESADYGRIVNARHFERLRRLLDGVSVVEGGETDEKERYVAPTIVEPVSWGDELMKEEIFGPILPVLTYDSLDRIIAEIAKRPSPLALYIFSSSRKHSREVLASIPFGGGCVNDTLMHIIGPHLPFGGVGNSGIGRYHGKASFEVFSYQKTILDKPFFPDIPLRYPPFTALKQKMGKKLFG